ncbi:hypothetical protein MHFGQ_11890 [Moorella humiferrea]
MNREIVIANKCKWGGGGYNYHNPRLLEINLLYILFLLSLLFLCLARGKIILLFHNSPKPVNLLPYVSYAQGKQSKGRSAKPWVESPFMGLSAIRVGFCLFTGNIFLQ